MDDEEDAVDEGGEVVVGMVVMDPAGGRDMEDGATSSVEGIELEPQDSEGRPDRVGSESELACPCSVGVAWAAAPGYPER